MRRVNLLQALALGVGLIAGTIQHAASNPPPAAISELAPDGRLRAAINFGNPILATRDPATGEARGVSVDLARELARRLGVPGGPRHLRRGRKGGRRSQGQCLGRRIRGHRSRARGRHGLQRAARRDRGRVPRVPHLPDQEQRRSRSKRRARRRRSGQCLRPLPVAGVEEGAAGARSHVARGRGLDGCAEPGRGGRGEAATGGGRQARARRAPAGRPVHGHRPGDGDAEGPDSRRPLPGGVRRGCEGVRVRRECVAEARHEGAAIAPPVAPP